MLNPPRELPRVPFLGSDPGPGGPAPNGDIDRVLDETRAELFGFFVAMRLAVVPVIVGLLWWVAAVEPAPWRKLALAVLGTAVLVGAAWEHVRLRRRGSGQLAIGLNVAVVVVALIIGLGLTGGLASPLLPVIAAVALLVGAFASRPMAWALVSVLVMAVVGFALASHRAVELVPEAFQSSPAAAFSTAHPWTLAAVTVLVVLAVAQGARRLRRGYDNTLRRAAAAREESLRLYTEHTRALTLLSGAIAHELKNPLASVKGLAALLARRAQGKDAERLAILRREVDRIAESLQELLDFTRPAVPLEPRPTDLMFLADEVARMHEGLARQRGAAIHVVGPASAVVECDPRKVEQILVNLIQNALEASPAGRPVWVRVEPGPSGVTIAVEDEGDGIPVDERERVFEPGVTGKPAGTGLGLPVARGLARQHGGDLVASATPRGGARMELSLRLTVAAEEVR